MLQHFKLKCFIRKNACGFSFFFSCLFIHTVFCIAQQPTNLRFHKIPDEFLQSAEIERFYVTKDDCLWFGTNKGLASFDGSEMIYYGSKGLNGTQNYRVTDLVEDNNGNLWLISPEYGLLYFNRKTGLFKTIDISLSKQIRSPQIEFVKIFIDTQGVLWIGSWYRGFFMYNPMTNVCKHYNLDTEKPADWQSKYENSVRDIIQDKQATNILWLACYGSGIYSFNKRTKALSKKFNTDDSKNTVFQPNTITSLQQINDSIIWFSTWGWGMGMYNMKTGLYHPYQRNSGWEMNVYTNGHILEYIAKKSDSEFYVAPRDTIPAIFNTNTKKFYFINDAELNKEFQKTTNVKTSEDDIVFYQKGGGLFLSSPKFNLFQQISINKKNTLYPEIQCMFWDEKEQSYYAGVQHSEGVYKYDRNFKLLKIITMPPYAGNGIANSTSIWKLFRDKANNFWALGYITSIYDSSEKCFIPVAKKWKQLKFLDSPMIDVVEDKNGLLYFSSLNNEFIILNPFTLQWKKLLLPTAYKTPPLNSYDNTVMFDSSRNFIYFINKNNLCQYNIISKTFRQLYVSSSYYINQSEEINCSYTLDEQGFIWLTTPDHYLWKINPDKFRIIDTIKFINTHIDLNGARFYGFYKDYLLLSTFKSQLLFNTENYECIYLNRKNGLLLNQGSKEIFCNNNVFFTYAGSGITQYTTVEKLLQPEKKITPYISLILINNKPAEPDTLPQFLNKLQLNHTHNTISIEFSVIDQEFPDRLEYAYQLEKTDKDWTYTNSLNNRISYANLTPGNYVFKVKAREWGLQWSTEKKLLIIIAPPFWQTWWFISLCVIVILLLSFLFIHWRIETVRKKEQLKAKHEKDLLELEAKALRSQMNPHFIFNCLNSIKALIQEQEDEKAITYLTTFSKLIRTIFQNADKREITLFDEIETCRLYTQLENMRFGKKINYHFNVDQTTDLKSVMIPALTIQPFIENAIWHGIMPKEGEGSLTVTVEKKDGVIACIVDDDGIGRDMSMQNKFKSEAFHESKGVRLTQTRLNIDNALNERKATVEIIDKKDEMGKSAGTTVILVFFEE